MKLKLMLYFLFIGSIVVIAGCNFESTQTTKLTSLSECTEKSPGNWCYTSSYGADSTGEGCADTYEGCLSVRVVESKDPSDCDKIQTQETKDNCLINLANNP